MKIKKSLFGWSLDIGVDELREFRTLSPTTVFPLMKFLDKTFGFDFMNTAYKIYKEEENK